VRYTGPVRGRVPPMPGRLIPRLVLPTPAHLPHTGTRTHARNLHNHFNIAASYPVTSYQVYGGGAAGVIQGMRGGAADLSPGPPVLAIGLFSSGERISRQGIQHTTGERELSGVALDLWQDTAEPQSRDKSGGR